MTSVSDSGNKKLGASKQKPLLWSHKMQRKRQALSIDLTSILSELAASADPTSPPLSSSQDVPSLPSSYSESFRSSMSSSSASSFTSPEYTFSSQSSSTQPESSSRMSSSNSVSTSISRSMSNSISTSSSRFSYSWSSPSNSWSSTVTPWISASTTTEITTRTVTEVESSATPTLSLPHITVYQPIPTSTLTATLFSTTSEQTGALSTDGTGQGGNSFSRNTGAIVGVALAVAFVVISSAFLIFFGCRRHRSRRQLAENMWKPPLPDDASDRHSASAVMRELGFVSGASASEHSHDHARASADGFALSAAGGGHLSRHSSDGFQLSSQGHSSGESSTRGLLASAQLAHGDDGSTSYFPQMVDPRRPHNLIIPTSVPPLPPLPLTRSPASPNSPYSNPASLLNSTSMVSPAPAAAVPNTPSPSPQWPRPTMPLPAFGSTSELPRLLQNDSYVSFRDDADYSRSIVRPGTIMRRDSDMTPADDDMSFTFHHDHPGRAL